MEAHAVTEGERCCASSCCSHPRAGDRPHPFTTRGERQWPAWARSTETWWQRAQAEARIYTPRFIDACLSFGGVVSE